VVDLQAPDNMTAADVCNVTAQAIRLLLVILRGRSSQVVK
jgi:hypothetical protein